MRLHCPHCGMTHKFTVENALLIRTLRWEDPAEWNSVESLPVTTAAPSARAVNAVTASVRPGMASAMKLFGIPSARKRPGGSRAAAKHSWFQALP